MPMATERKPQPQSQKRIQRKTAVALRYKTGKDKAPIVVAKGKGLVAEKILKEAALHGIPLHEDKDLVELLSGVDILQEIPSELYAVVAEILVFVDGLNKK